MYTKLHSTSMRLLFFSFCVLSFGSHVFGQLTGTKTIPGDYASIALAVTDLNTQGVGAGGVTFDIAAGYTETLTATLSVTATGTNANPIIFQKSGAGANPLITSYTGTQLPTATTFVDGMWRFVGSDYVTIDAIDLVDAVGNTTATTTMEYGYGFYKASATDGANNNTVKNCTITLNRVNTISPTSGPRFQGSIGIELMACAPTAVNTTIVSTSVAGANSNNKFYANTIQNVNCGIAMTGSAVAAPYTLADLNNDIGGTALATGNNIINWGGGAAPATAATAVFVKDQWSFNVSYNNVDNNNGSGVNHAQAIRGIFANLSSAGASGTINNNTISIKGGGAFAVSCIESAAGSTANSNTITINNNTIQNCTNTLIATAAWYGIWNSGAPTNLNIQNNTFTNNQTSATSGITYLIYNNGAVPGVINMTGNQLSHSYVGAAATTGATYMIYNTTGTTATTLNINSNNFSNITHTLVTGTGVIYFIYNLNSSANFTLNANTWTNLSLNSSGAHYLMFNGSSTQSALTVTNNSIVTGFTRTAAAGTMYIYYCGSSSLPNSTQVFSGNNFSNITGTTAGTGTVYLLYTSDGATSPYPRKTIFNNTFSNISYPTTGITYAYYFSYLGESGGVGSNIYNNTCNNITTSGTLYGIATGTLLSPNISPNIYGNTVSNLTSNGAASIVYGSSLSSAVVGLNFYKNKIFNVTANGATGAVYGIQVTSTQPYNIHNNYVGNLNAPNSSLVAPAPSLAGIYLTAGSTVNLSYNTVNLSATAGGVNFGSTALYASSTPTLNLRNNILVNTSVANGTGTAKAYQRSTTTATTHAAVSNRNILYTGTPSATRLIFSDGTNNDQTIVDFKGRFAPAETLSGTENPTFLSTTGASPIYLHVSPSVATLAESGGANIIGITDDYDADIRFGNAGSLSLGTAPDIGADEFDGIPAPALAPPINFTSNTNTANSFNITWDDNSIGEAGFIVLRSLSAGGPFTQIAVVNTTSAATTGATYTLAQTGLLGGTTYYYQIVATNATNSTALTGSAATTACGTGLSGTYSVGPTGTYASIGAALTALQTNGMVGAVILELQAAYLSTVETFPLVFGNNIACLNPSNPLTIRPELGATGLSITSAVATQTIDLNGANYVTFDGRPGGLGTTSQLSIINTNAAGVAIRFINDASNNTITYCDVQGQNTVAAMTITLQAGVIYFNSAGPNLMGNDNNTISNCNIHGTGITTATFPTIGIGAFGTATSALAYNDNCTITNCKIYDIYNATLAATHIKVDAGNTAWTISNNNFYQTILMDYLASTATYRALWITPNTASISNAANGFIITGNYIGGSNAAGAGTWGMTGTGAYIFNGMDLSVGLGTATSIQNNTITNISAGNASTNSLAFVGINIANGNANVGTVTGNTIGSASTTGAITYSTSLSGGGVVGIRTGGGTGNTFNIANNTIAGIDLFSNATTACNNFNGINIGGGTNATANITNNTIGSTTVANSININSTSATTTTASACRGIIVNGGTPIFSITGNTIANMNSNYSAAGTQATTMAGIIATVGAGSITNNTIRNLYSAAQTTAGAPNSLLQGIGYNSTSTLAVANISGNTIHTLKANNAAATGAIQVCGLFYSGPTGANNMIAKNNIHSLSMTTTAAPGAFITGMDIAFTNPVTVLNNMIRLGLDETGASITNPCTIRGITKNTAIANIWFNSIYIGGTNVGTTATNTFAFARSASAATDDIRNNIFVNNRSNATTGGKHYSINLTSTATMNCDYNHYYGNGTGYVFGFNGVDVPTYTNGWVPTEINSYTGDPAFLNPTGTAATGDLHIDPSIPTLVDMTGILIPSVLDDIDGDVRSTAYLTPTDKGADAGHFSSLFCTGLPTPGTASAVLTPICAGNISVLSVNGYTAAPGISLQWKVSPTAGGPYTNVTGGLGATTSIYTTGALSTTGYYVCEVTCSAGSSALSSEQQIIVNNPQITGTTPPSRCGTGTVSLAATGSAGTTLSWYDPASVLVGTGSPVTSPIISATTTYNVQATIPSGPGVVTLGTGTITNGTTGYPSPYGQFYGADHEQYLIRATELQALGLIPGNISTIAFNLALGYTGAAMQNFQVMMAPTTATAMTASLITTGFTTVYGGPGTTYTPGGATGWATIPFTTPFFWDGTSNVVVDVSFLNCTTCPPAGCGTNFTTNGSVNQTATAYVSTVYFRADGNCTINTMAPSVAATGTVSQRPNMRFTGFLGCTSPLTPVVATVLPPPALAVTPTQTMCNGATASLGVTSTVSDYDGYTWAPLTNLFTDIACTIPYTGVPTTTGVVYFNSTTAGTYSYTLTSTNSTTPFCGNTANTIVRVQPASVTIASMPPTICVSGSSVITETGTAFGIQWQDSVAGVWANIATATNPTYTTPTINATQYYRVTILDGTGAMCTQTPYPMVVNNPQVTSAPTPVTRCGPGTLTLDATSSPGANLYWYNIPAANGTPLGSGTSYTTAILSAPSTNYYVVATNGGAGTPANLFTTNAAGNGAFGNIFDVDAVTNIRIDSFSIFATVANTTYSVYYRLGTGNGFNTSVVGWTLIGSGTMGAVNPIPANFTMIPLNVNLLLTAGQKYSFAISTGSTVSYSNGVGAAGVAISAQNGDLIVYNGYGGSTTNPGFGFANNPRNYNGRIYYTSNLACASPPSTVVANVTVAPALTITPNKLTCNSTITPLAVTSNLSDYDGYSWSPSTDLYTDAAATVPYTGTVLSAANSTVYFKSSSTAFSTNAYTCTGSNTLTPFCGNIVKDTIRVQPATINVTATPVSICVSGSTVLTLTGTTLGIQWQDSTAGVWANIAGATSTTYTTPTLTADKKYRAVINDGTGTPCFTKSYLVVVNNPQITGSTPAARCGTGTVQLGATATPGAATINWYAAATGGSSLATGSPFTTPTISSTTTYYASAIVGSSAITTTIGTGTLTNTTTSYPSPFGQFYGADHEQYLILASELNALGLTAGNINSIAFNLSAPYTFTPLSNFQIRMANTTATAMTTSLITTGITSVYGPLTYTPPNATGWSPISLTTPFFWDGSSNLVVDVSFLNCSVCNGTSSCATAFTSNGSVFQTATPFVSSLYMIADGNCSTNTMSPFATGTATPAIGTTISQRPNMQFNIDQGCASTPRVPVVATVSTPPALTLSASTANICSGVPSTLINVTAPSPVGPSGPGGTGGYDTYTWSAGANETGSAAAGFTISPATSGTYTLTAAQTDPTSLLCQNVATVAVTVNPNPVLTASATPGAVCDPGNSVLATNVTSTGLPTAAPYCVPSHTTGTGFGDYISTVAIGATALNNVTGPSAAPYVTLYPATGSTTATLPAGATVYTMTLSAGTYTFNDVAAWIDLDQNGVFSAAEKIGEFDDLGATPATATFTFTVPVTALNGPTLLRVRETDHATTNDMDPCIAYAWGETEDYTVTITGGANPPGISYLWSPSTFLSSTTVASPNVTAITATTNYTVTVTNTNGCFGTAPATVTVNPRPTSVISGGGTICDGFSSNISVALTGISPWNLTYDDGTTATLVTTTTNPYVFAATTAGTYTITQLSDGNNCNSQAADRTGSAIVVVNPRPTSVVSGGGIVCTGATLPNVDIALTGTGPWTIIYTPDGGTTSITVPGITTSPYTIVAAPVGTYTVTSVTDANCFALSADMTGSATVTVTASVGTPVFTMGASSTRCQGAGTLNYDATATTTTGITYTLDAASLTGLNTIDANTGAVTFDASWSGTSVITASAAGCNGPTIATHTVTINPTPSAAVAGPDMTGCNTAVVTMSPTAPLAGTGVWTGGLGTWSGNDYTPDATEAANGAVITATWTVSSGVCPSNAATATITISAPVTAIAGADQTSCGSAVVTMSPTAPSIGTGVWTGGAGTWSGNDYTPNTTEATAGAVITATWTVTNGTCVATSTASITINGAVSANAGANQTSCGPAVVTMSPTAPSIGTGVWTGGAGTWSGNDYTPGSGEASAGAVITATWTVTNGTCVQTATATITINVVPATLTTSVTPSCGSTSLAVTSAITGTLEWRDNSNPTLGLVVSNANPYIVTTAGTYYAFDKSALGCYSLAAAQATGAIQGIPVAVATPGTGFHSANTECTDASGWTHYWEDPTPASANSGDELLLLSINKTNYTGAGLGVLGSTFLVQVNAASGYSTIQPDITPPLNYANQPWPVMNRYWKVTPLNEPTPGDMIPVRFYYTMADYMQIPGVTSPIDLDFYKVNDVVTTYNVDPTSGHQDIPLATTFNADGFWLYQHASSSTISTWTGGNHGADFYADMVIGHFGGGGGGSPAGPLPINLLSFTGHNEGVVNILNWETSSEINAARFDVYRSADNNMYEKIGQKAAVGTPSQGASYEFVDNQPIVGANYYQLKMVDLDGTQAKSNIVEIMVSANFNYTIYPNPMSDKLNVELRGVKGATKFTLYNALGQEVMGDKWKDTDPNLHQIDVSNLAKGVYYYELRNQDQKYSGKIVKD